MKLKQQITLFAVMALLVPAVLISSISLYRVNSRAEADILAFEESENNKLRIYLKHITDVAYGLIDTRHKQAQSAVETDSTANMEALMAACLADLSTIRFDRGEGYFWVTDNQLPYPTMIMHAEKPKLQGQVLSDPSFNVEKRERRNIYQVRAELCNANGDAFVDYIMKKPGSEEVVNKVSYSRLHRPTGWIISAGFYTDQIAHAIAEKRELVRAQINEIMITIIVITLLITALGLWLSMHFSGKLSRAINIIRDKLRALGLGHQVDELAVDRKDEVGEMTESLNTLIRGLRSYTAFAKQIGEGNLATTFQPLSTEDMLGNELLEMRTNLKNASDEKSVRDWFNEGLANLGDVLRHNNNNTAALADEVTKSLIKYVHANQGALFLYREGEEEGMGELELFAMYAYDRKRYVDKKIGAGNGLIGQCVYERSTVYLKEVPSDYVAITSGLGQALPRCVLIVPLIHNEKVYGAIEMASFNELKEHEISFVEKAAESIASTIATVMVNENTRKLLEESQQLSEEMKAQEEELRQNQEELQATQEQMERKQKELEQENQTLREMLAKGNGKNVKSAA